MAVVYPSEDDARVLVGFMEFCTQQEDVQAMLGVTEKDVQTVSGACRSVLAHLRRAGRLILASIPLNQAEDAQLVSESNDRNTAYKMGSVYPHISQHPNLMGYITTLPESAGAAPPLLHQPKSFLGPQLDAIDLMEAELKSAMDTLLSVNATHAYLWTTNVDELRRYIAHNERRQQIQQSMRGRAQMRAASVEETPRGPAPDSIHEIGPRDVSSQQGDVLQAAVNPPEKIAPTESFSESSVQAPSRCALLELDASQLPSKQVQRSFMKFIQACVSLLEWVDSVLGLLSGKDDVPKAGTFEVPVHGSFAQRGVDIPNGAGDQGPTVQGNAPTQRPGTKTMRVYRYEIRNVRHIYDMFYQQAECFYLPQYALYDARIKQRILQPSYYYALRTLIGDITAELTRLEQIAASRAHLVRDDGHWSSLDAYQRGAPGSYAGVFGAVVDSYSLSRSDRVVSQSGEATKIVFEPALPQFSFLRNTLRVLLSVCLNEDDRTSFKRFEELYQAFVGSSRGAITELHHLPKPPPPSLEDAAQRRFRNGDASAAGHPRYKLLLVSPNNVEQPMLSGGEVPWALTTEDCGRLRAGFEAYWELRDGVRSLKSSLEKDIRRKDETHRTRVLGACVAREKDSLAIMAREHERGLQEALLRSRRESGGWLSAARASLRSLAGIVACKAEVQMEDLGIPTVPERDDAGEEMTTTSPYHAEKKLLQESVNRLWRAVEAHGVHMEREYPGLFYRSERGRWVKRIGSLIEKANAVGVVFSP
ncbi:hypothetical protein JKF63_05305 [Porcisia hertigi]|uniref:Uncharacterized protein n=1 Tax=Porcisia hertigi TaxID=2761500 RepID=A0A836LE23_9TRYP|nr:hypothetical protein JKF63_05305 [Porcisia hertigi]